MSRHAMFQVAYAAALFAGGCTAVQAAVESHTYVFRAGSFTPLVNPSSISPYATVTGKFTLMYDRLVSKPEGLDGILLANLTTPIGSPVAFRYDYIDAVDIGLIQIGASENGIGGVGSDDFFLAFQFTGVGAPQFSGFNFGDAAIPNEYFVAGSGRVAEIAVPEPAAWALMVAGFGLVGSASRRRRAEAVA